MFKKYNFKHNLITQSYNAIQNCTVVSYFKASLRDHCRDTEKISRPARIFECATSACKFCKKDSLMSNFPPLKLGKKTFNILKAVLAYTFKSPYIKQ